MHLVAWQARISEIISFVSILLNVEDDEEEELEEAAEEAAEAKDLLKAISLVVESPFDPVFVFKSKIIFFTAKF